MAKMGGKKPKQERSKGTVEAVYGAFARILDQDGPIALTTNKIAEVAGVSVGSLYQYFRNKESIVEALLLKMTETNLERMEKIMSEIEPGTKSLREIVRKVVDSQFEGVGHMGKSTSFLLQYAPRILPITHFQKSDERVARFLAEQMARHGFLKNVENPRAVFFVVAQAARATMLMSYLTQEPEERLVSKDALAEMIASYFEALDGSRRASG